MLRAIIPSLLLNFSLLCHAETITADFANATHIPVTASSYTATGNQVDITLSHTPSAGSAFTIVKNTGLDFIDGEFSNLSHGQTIALSYAGKSYDFVVNYYGGDGNDLVLQWGFVDIVGLARHSNIGPDKGALVGRKIMASSYGMALCNDGRIVTWDASYVSSIPVLVDNTGALAGKTVVAISGHESSKFALCSDGTVVAWGLNHSGQLCNGTTINSNVPVAVNLTPSFANKKIIRISAGRDNFLALCSDNTLLAWGEGGYGQMGDGTSQSTNSSPREVSRTGVLQGKTISKITADYACYAICTDGTIASWGWGAYGQLGTGDSGLGSTTLPVLVKTNGVLAGKTVTKITTNRYGSTFALCDDSTAAAWGRNANGILGIGSLDFLIYEPTLVSRDTFLSGKIVTHIVANSDNGFFACDDATIGFTGIDTYNYSPEPKISPIHLSSLNFPTTSEIIELHESHLLLAREISSNANLANIIQSVNTLMPSFDQNSTSYSINVSNSTSTINLTPVASDSNAVVRVSGSTINRDQVHTRSLTVGANAVVFDVTAEDGTVKSYTVTINRAPSNTNTLSSLTQNNTNINLFNLADIVPFSTTTTIIKATTSEPNATIMVNGVAVVSGGNSAPIQLAVGANTIPIVVTAQDGISTRNYNLTITRLGSVLLTSFDLSVGTLTPTFRSSTTTYTSQVTNPTNSILINAIPEDVTATIWINGVTVQNPIYNYPISLDVGSNTITVTVLAGNVSARSYTATITRLPSTDATLAALTTTAGAVTPTFNTNVNHYTLNVENAVTSVSVIPVANSSAAAVQVVTQNVASGSPSQAIALHVGANQIPITVTAEDGVSKMTYTVTVNRAPSSDASLISLVSNVGTLSPSFASGILEYTFTVGSSTSAIQLTPTKSNQAASITVNAIPVTSGVATGNISLLMGRNEITVRVIAEDTNITTDYKLYVTRTPALDSISFSEGVLSPTFTAQGLNYTLPITSGASSFRVTPSSPNAEVSIQVNDEIVATDTASNLIPLTSSASVTISAVGVGGVRTDYLITAKDARDPDGDGLTNFQELEIHQTNPTLADTDGDGINDSKEILNNLNPKSADSDNDGLTDNIESSSGGMNNPIPRVGDDVLYDLSSMMASGNRMLLSGRMPAGLSIDSATGKISGVVSGKPGIYRFSLRIMNGRTIVKTIPITIPVLPYPTEFLGTFHAMLHDSGGLAIGMLTCVITTPGRFTATMNRSGVLSILRIKGSFTLKPGENDLQILLNFPNNAVFINLDTQLPIVTGTHSQGIVSGHRLATESQLPTISEKATILFDHGTHDGISAPAGLGSATMLLQKNGTTTLRGQTGDAKKFTARANLTGTGQIMLWVNHYREANSYFGGVLQARAGSVSMINNQIVWKKAPILRDRSYPEGFGPFAFLSSTMQTPTTNHSQNLLDLWTRTTNEIPLFVDGAGLPNLVNDLPTSLSLANDFSLKNANHPRLSMRIAKSTYSITGNISWKESNGIAARSSEILGVVTPGRSSLFAAGLIVVPQSQPAGSYRTAAMILEFQ